MTRVPLRPLARILRARAEGENPDGIEAENIRLRQEVAGERLRRTSARRLTVSAILTVMAFGLVGLRMWGIAAEPVTEPVSTESSRAASASRAEIHDRNGRILAMNLLTQSLYAHPQEMTDPGRAIEALVEVFPELDLDRLTRDLTGQRKFVWIRSHLSPEQRQAVHDIGEPGLYFGPREMRLYPNGTLAAHVLGGTRFDSEGVRFAELVGTAGVERQFDTWLRDPAHAGLPLTLSIDLTAQAVMEEVLAGGMALMNAKGAAGILMHAHTGEIRAIASLPLFDPNDRPAPPTTGDPADSPIFNRAVQGTYELGSTFKIFAVAQALDLGLISPGTMINTQGPLRVGGFKISDFRNYGAALSATQVIVKSSNIGTARIIQMVGKERQRAFLDSLGLLEPTPVELPEAAQSRPSVPRWEDIESTTISYGHGISVSPLHLATAYASLLNGGMRVTPTLLRRPPTEPGPRLVRAESSAQAREMLREVVEHGTATMAQVPGYDIGGKTGTADKPSPTGGYYEDKVIATFAAILPTQAPEYVLIVMLDEPSDTVNGEVRRTAGWTAAPVAAELTRRLAPLLGLRPSIAAASEAALNQF